MSPARGLGTCVSVRHSGSVSVATPLRSIVEATRQGRAPADYVPQHGLDDAKGDGPLVVVPWSKWGKRRLYVSTADGDRVGWVDLDTGERSLAVSGRASEFEAAIQSYSEDAYLPRRGIAAPAEQARSAATSPRRAEPEPTDLTGNRPGEQLEDQIAAALQAGQEPTPSGTGLSGERGCSGSELGVLGERKVAEELDRLVALDPRWAYINSIPVGTNNSDIDHLAVGPGGVFTINAKHHHDANVWVGEDALMVSGIWKHYVRNSRHEAESASKLLSATANTAVSVRGLIVPVGVADLTVKEQPSDVQVVDGSQLVDFLMSQPAVLDAYMIALVLTCARLSTTWRPLSTSLISG